jgi:hypothetical protein
VRGTYPFQNLEEILPEGERNEIAKVIGRKRNADGVYVGRAYSTTILDSRTFTVPDGDEKGIA